MYRQIETYLTDIAETHMQGYYDNDKPYFWRETVIVERDTDSDNPRPCGQSVSPYIYMFSFDNPDRRNDETFEDAFMDFVEVFDNLNIANNEIDITDRNGNTRKMFIEYLEHNKLEESKTVTFELKVTFDIYRTRS